MTQLRFRWIVLGLFSSMALISTGCMSPQLSWRYNPGATFRSNAIPEKLPLGSTIRAHFHQMQTNAEASDFVFYNNDFKENTAELTPYAKDRILEIGARMRSAPFPVLIERSRNNADPELDAHRRAIVAQILTDLGNPDAETRTIVAPAYAKGANSIEGEIDYYQFINTRGGNDNGGFNNGNSGSFGGAGFGF